MAEAAVMAIITGAQMINDNQVRQKAKGVLGKQRREIEAQIKTLSAGADAAKVGAVGATAAAKAKKKLGGQSKQGYSGTLLTGPKGVMDRTPTMGRGTSTLLGL